MVKQRMTHLFRKADSGFGGKKLRCDRADESHHAKRRQQQTHFDGIASVASADALVDDGRDHQWHQQLKRSLQQLEERSQNAFLFVAF